MRKFLREMIDCFVIDFNFVLFCLVSGLGFGVMSGAFSLINILADSVGPGTVGLISGDNKFFFYSSLTTLAFVLLHTFWGIIFFRAWDHRNYILVSYVIISHYAASGIVSKLASTIIDAFIWFDPVSLPLRMFLFNRIYLRLTLN